MHAIAVTGTGVEPVPVDPGPVDPGPVDPGPVDPGPIAPEPEPVPTPIGPVVFGLGRPELIVEKLRPALSVSKAQPSRDGRKLVIRGRVTAAAIGPLSVRLTARIGHKTVATTTRLRLRGRSTYTITMVIPKAARAWTRLQIQAHFPGSDRVWPGTGSLVLVRGRYLGGA